MAFTADFDDDFGRLKGCVRRISNPIRRHRGVSLMTVSCFHFVIEKVFIESEGASDPIAITAVTFW
jgi:hypothetical protein